MKECDTYIGFETYNGTFEPSDGKTIQVGEYVRTKCGEIGKAAAIKGQGFKEEFVQFEKSILCDINCFYNRKGEEVNEIVKHSFNIIDLIEEGDYVNGHRVEEIIDGIDEKIITTDAGDLVKGILDYEIKSILTKQKFKEHEYKIEEV